MESENLDAKSMNPFKYVDEFGNSHNLVFRIERYAADRTFCCEAYDLLDNGELSDYATVTKCLGDTHTHVDLNNSQHLVSAMEKAGLIDTIYRNTNSLYPIASLGFDKLEVHKALFEQKLSWTFDVSFVRRDDGYIFGMSFSSEEFYDIANSGMYNGEDEREHIVKDFVNDVRNSFKDEGSSRFIDKESFVVISVHKVDVNDNCRIIERYDYPLCTQEEAELYKLDDKKSISNYQKPILDDETINVIREFSSESWIDDVFDKESKLSDLFSLKPEFEGQEFLIKDGVLLRSFSTKENVVVPDGVKEIGKYAFANGFNFNEGIENVVLPDTVLKVEDCAFLNCSCLSDIRMSQNISEIGSKAFMGCDINKVTLPKSIKKLGEDAFTHGELVVPETLTAEFGYVKVTRYPVFKQEESEIKSQKNNNKLGL